MSRAFDATQESHWDREVILLVSIGALYVAWLAYYTGETRRLQHIPSLGHGSALLSYIDGFKVLVDGKKFVSDRLEKISAPVIKIPNPLFWKILIRDRNLVEEYRRAPDEIFSGQAATIELLQAKYTITESGFSNTYHVPIVKNQLKKATPELVPTVHEELAQSFDEYITATTQDWVEVDATDVSAKVICRASNRVFVGLALCRDPDFIELNINYTIDVMKMSIFLQLFPRLMRPLVAWMVPMLRRRTDQALRHLVPVIRQRKETPQNDRPTDFLDWLIQAAEGEEATEEALSARVLFLNFAAIHTSSMTFIRALNYLAAYPEFHEPLRQEARAAVGEHGWSKEAVDKMPKIDSFIKESQRLWPAGTMGLQRIALQDYTFSNGVTVPKGTWVSTDLVTAHSRYSNAEEFDPWRFYNIHKESGKPADITTTTPEYLLFGHGRHACPGRFFAAVELKTMIAHMVLAYDMKLPEGLHQPDTSIRRHVENPKGKVLFRKRL
ncbi:cytochrome P450 [Coprinopsis marcescibilis]|uniref:Cytochrome P450 n=1 Tax=Coprinopsis marcescibilis TaxID=230819 RepID=A0A5C3KHY9_COPMA|nr:cytochrome P450 [Coprinopsis marcescibilis]